MYSISLSKYRVIGYLLDFTHLHFAFVKIFANPTTVRLFDAYLLAINPHPPLFAKILSKNISHFAFKRMRGGGGAGRVMYLE